MNDNNPRRTGRIYRYYTVWCALCEDYRTSDIENTIREFEATVRDEGWIKTRRYGWLCRDCAKFSADVRERLAFEGWPLPSPYAARGAGADDAEAE